MRLINNEDNLIIDKLANAMVFMNLNITNFLAKVKGQKLLLACSGGVDSMVLLNLLHRAKFDFIVVHVNYHKRGMDSDLDMKLVQSECANHNIHCIVRHYTSNEQVGNFQEKARNFRYAIFSEEMKKNQCDSLVLGHHFDDQMETFFMNLTRKSGVLGLSAMLQQDGVKIRPLLNTTKKEIYEYAKNQEIQWREDLSNQNSGYTRNRWRNEFLPLISSQLPELENSVRILIEKFQSEHLRLVDKVKDVVKQIDEHQKLNFNTIGNLSEYELFEIWRQLKQEASTFDLFLALPNLQKGKFISARKPYARVIKERDYLFFETADHTSDLPAILIEDVQRLPESLSKNELYLDKSKVIGELQIRTWKTGDRIKPIGMTGSQLVSDIIKDAQIPNHERDTIVVVNDSNAIHWVVGLKIGRMALAAKDCANIIKVSLNG